MAAQQGDAILLAYGPQGSQQAGATIVLSYQAAPAPGRRLTAGTAAPWGAAAAATLGIHAHHAATAEIIHPAGAPWPPGRGQDAEADAPWGVASIADDSRAATWPAFGRPAQPEPTSRWGVSATRDDRRASPWERFTGRAQHTPRAPWVVSIPRDHQEAAPWGGPMTAFGPAILAIVVPSAPADQLDHSPWSRYSRPLAPGWGVVTPPGEPPKDPSGTLLVPIQQVYIMVNEATLIRVDDGTALPVLSLSASTDVDSWAWRVDASLPASYLDAVMPGMDGAPVLLQAVINGYPVRWVAESVSRDRSFGKNRIKVSGRSPSAMLADPFAVAYSYASADAITAQQAAINAVTEVGLPAGWDIAWHITDWLLPPGLWQHQGTPMSAVQRIAEAAGAYVQTDALLQTLHVRHRYPSAPWGWAALTPDLILPTDAVLREGVEWGEKPAYNEVYVSGQSLGVLGRVVKAGTTGGLAAGTVVDDLITHADAARQRGRAILSDTGRQQRMSLSLPIGSDVPLLEVGQFIDVTEGAGPSLSTRRGLVRGLSATYSAPSARQTVEVEVHG